MVCPPARGDNPRALVSGLSPVHADKPWYNHTMVCPPARGENPRALASVLSPVQADNHGITILYQLHPCRLAQYEIFRA